MIFLVRFVQGLLEQVKTYPEVVDLQKLQNSMHRPTLIDQFRRNHEAYVVIESLLDEEVVVLNCQLHLFMAFT